MDSILSTEMESNNQKKKQQIELQTFQICDHLFRSYLECINTFSVQTYDCVKICDTLENINLCKIKIKLDK